MPPTVIDIPASLATLIPSAETFTTAIAWLIMGFAALIALSIPVLILSWLQTASKPKAPRKKTEQEPVAWLPKKYVAADHH